MFEQLKFYVIREASGKYYKKTDKREKWTDDITKARVYPRIGPARGVVSSLIRDDKILIIELLELSIGNVEIIDEMTRYYKNNELLFKKKRRLQEEIAAKKMEQAKKEYEELMKNV